MLLKIVTFYISSFLICFYLIPVLIRIANKYSIYRHSDLKRKELTNIPFLGGFAIVLSFYATLTVFANPYAPRPLYSQFFLVAMFFLFFMGLADDLLHYNFNKKIIIKVSILSIMIYKCGFAYELKDLITIYSLSVPVCFIVVLFLFCFVIKAVNAIDGSEGLAASLSLISFAAYSILFFIYSQSFYCAIAVTYCGALTAFLFYNKPPSFISMGNAGSLFIGLGLAACSFFFIVKGNTFSVLPTCSRTVLAFSFISIPVMDIIRLFIHRTLLGKAVFKNYNKNIFSLISGLNISPRQVMYFLTLLQISLIGLALAITNTYRMAGFLLLTAGLYLIIAQLVQHNYNIKQNKISEEFTKEKDVFNYRPTYSGETAS